MRMAPLKPNDVAHAVLTRPDLHGPSTTVAELRTYFLDDHVHMALIVDAGRLVATVEREDLDSDLPDGTPARIVGSLEGRTVDPNASLSETVELMKRTGRRRLAVVDAQSLLLGLLCLKADGHGFCSDDGVESRKRADGS